MKLTKGNIEIEILCKQPVLYVLFGFNLTVTFRAKITDEKSDDIIGSSFNDCQL